MNPKYQSLAPIFSLGCGLLILSIPLSYIYPGLFERYFGDIYPPLVLLGTVLLALLAQYLLVDGKGAAPISTGNLKGAWHKVLLAAAFSIPSMVLDLLGTFPMDINVRWPASLLFYVIIAYVVEALFHLLPLMLSYRLFKMLKPGGPVRSMLLNGMLWVSALEPLFQSIAGFRNGSPFWSMSILFVSLYLFNFYQLRLYINHGFLALFGSRISYYFLWHVMWGELRLILIF